MKLRFLYGMLGLGSLTVIAGLTIGLYRALISLVP